MLAIIGGSGLSQLPCMEFQRREVMRTPYGEPSGPVTFGTLKERPAAFLARHGYGHTIAPHEINYRANLWALRELRATRVVSVAAVGGIREDLVPGTVVVPHQIIDYTWGRRHTFFEGEAPVTHIDFTEPFSAEARADILAAALACNEPVVDGAVYAATQGPRLETAAEIDRLERDGAEIVGMTAMPEAALAKELELPYAAIAVVANFAAGRGDSRSRINLDEIDAVLRNGMLRVARMIEQLAGKT
ncbi:MAG: 5'-methylthioadenosine phosphorylase [Betaproteobacteria bacterium RIFCSPLOWO2_02_FULL_65_24]|nr:MAG: 5'-methylthioadenosine phosphorylase [Betaproteobacteria bacterium RIFCSPLOWO2_02_FULL_65_24]